MILAITFMIGAAAAYWSMTTAGARGGSSRSSIADVSMAMMVSLILSGFVYAMGALWAVLADASTSSGNVRYDVFRAWLVLVGPIVSLVIVPAAYAASNALQQHGFPLTDRWRMFGFPSIVVATYLILNVVSIVTGGIGGWAEVSLWSYALVPVHGAAVFASYVAYAAGMDRLVART